MHVTSRPRFGSKRGFSPQRAMPNLPYPVAAQLPSGNVSQTQDIMESIRLSDHLRHQDCYGRTRHHAPKTLDMRPRSIHREDPRNQTKTERPVLGKIRRLLRQMATRQASHRRRNTHDLAAAAATGRNCTRDDIYRIRNHMQDKSHEDAIAKAGH